MYGFSLRMYDQRLGRWHATDPYEQHWSPYLAMSNNPVSYVDPDGGWDYIADEPGPTTWWGWENRFKSSLQGVDILPNVQTVQFPGWIQFGFDRPASAFMFSRMANSGYVGMASTALIMQSAGMLRSQINMVHAGEAPTPNRMEEPARNQAGSIESAAAEWRTFLDINDQTIDGIAAYVRVKNLQTEEYNIRYVYTTQRGWIDLSHYFVVQQKGIFLTNLLEPVGGTSIGQLYLSEDADRSTFSYEDLPSNKFSSEIDLSNLSGDDLISKIVEHFISIGATNPEEAPNWRQIPLDDHERNRLPETVIVSPSPIPGSVSGRAVLDIDKLKTGLYTPQNRSDKPYPLQGFHPAPTSLEATEGKQ